MVFTKSIELESIKERFARSGEQRWLWGSARPGARVAGGGGQQYQQKLFRCVFVFEGPTVFMFCLMEFIVYGVPWSSQGSGDILNSFQQKWFYKKSETQSFIIVGICRYQNRASMCSVLPSDLPITYVPFAICIFPEHFFAE